MQGDKKADDKRRSPLSFARLRTALKPKTRNQNTENFASQGNAPQVVDSAVPALATLAAGPLVQLQDFTNSESWIVKDEDRGVRRGDTEWDYIPKDSPLKGKEKARPIQTGSGLSQSILPVEVQASNDIVPVFASSVSTPAPSSVENPLTLNSSATPMLSSSDLLGNDANTDTPTIELTGDSTGEMAQPMPFDPYGDREATERRYKKATENLEAALKLPRKNWKTFEIPDFKNLVNVNDPIPELREAIKKTLDARANAITDKSLWAKGKRWTEGIFTAVSPFTKNVLLVAKDGASVIPGGSSVNVIDDCNESIADREFARRKSVEEKFEYISRQLGQLVIINRLPETKVQSDQVVNRAMDVLSAALTYIAVHVKHESNLLGILGTSCYEIADQIGGMGKSIFRGEEHFTAVERGLKDTVDEFNSTLANFGLGVAFELGPQTLKEVQGTREDLQDLRQELAAAREIQIQITDCGTIPNARFIVPYQRNANFTGRADLLMQLRAKLCDIVPKSWNHRVALHGLGGIGKTQLALEYVYAHEKDYERIYWISAVNEATIIGGLQEIAKRTKCISRNEDLSPEETANRVLDWLNVQPSCLLVFDNLDQIEVIDRYFLNQSPGRHTLITSRNPYSDQIPSEGLKVDQLDEDEAVELLLLRSGIREPTEKAPARPEAAKIVKELGYLPLAIEQAAAYIREVLRDLSKFLPLYLKDRKKHLKRTSKANRSYYTDSVGTTWRMSFIQIANNNSDAPWLLQLLSFLNPDGVLTDFLEVGARGLPDELKNIVADNNRFYEALSELEVFSLIGRQSDAVSGQRITIHRLVQSVVRDDMSPSLISTVEDAVLGLCEYAVPSFHDMSQTSHQGWCRRILQEQVVIPLLSLSHQSTSSRLGMLLSRVGTLLDASSGNWSQACVILAMSVEILASLQGGGASETLDTMMRLALSYQSAGRLTDAALLGEKVLGIVRQVHGEGTLASANAMTQLSSIYSTQGRLEEALALSEKALEIQRRLLPENDEATLTSMSALGVVYRFLGRYDDAAVLNEEVLNARLSRGGPDDLILLRTRLILMEIYLQQVRCEKALEFGQESVTLCTKALGTEHRFTILAMKHLGYTYLMLNRLTEAAPLLETSYRIAMKMLQSEDIVTVETTQALAVLYANVGRYEDSIRLAQKAIDGGVRIFGLQHSNTLTLILSLSSTYFACGRFDDSIELLDKCYNTLNVARGEENLSTLDTMSVVASAYLDLEKFDRSIAAFEKVISGRMRLLGAEHPETEDAIKSLERACQARDGD